MYERLEDLEQARRWAREGKCVLCGGAVEKPEKRWCPACEAEFIRAWEEDKT